MFQIHVDLLQWREKDLTREQNRVFVRQGVELARETGKIFLLNSDMELALQERADGVHLTSRQDLATALKQRMDWKADRFIVGKSVHSVEECVEAASQGADYALLGPVFSPISKESRVKVLGLRTLEVAARAVSIPVFALGGMDEPKIGLVVASGAAGVAGISWINDEVRRRISTLSL